MKKLYIAVLLMLLLAACGGSDPAIEERIIGTWSGAQTNSNGDKVPATWQFIEGGTMIVEIPAVNMSYGAEWAIEGDNRITIATELAPDTPTYRDIEFVSDDVFKASKDDFTETWSRQ